MVVKLEDGATPLWLMNRITEDLDTKMGEELVSVFSKEIES
jgi:hypothetical protein